jgi:uncharacterized protein with ATP-grasp and redox domains
MQPECLVCLYNQALRASKIANCDYETSLKIMQFSAFEIGGFSMEQTPPDAAAKLYPLIADIAKKEDIYKEIKAQSTKTALQFVDFAEEKLLSSQDKIDAMLKLGVAGNVIDFATEVMFDFEQEIKNIFKKQFAIYDKEVFEKKLLDAQNIVVIGDNVGEHVFDKMMIKTIKELNQGVRIDYFVRGVPIINDVTQEDTTVIGLDKICNIVDTKMRLPGFLPLRASKQARELYENADLIISKGMGNFECLEALKNENLFFLFKVKCSVVANKIGKNIGDIICKQNL